MTHLDYSIMEPGKAQLHVLRRIADAAERIAEALETLAEDALERKVERERAAEAERTAIRATYQRLREEASAADSRFAMYERRMASEQYPHTEDLKRRWQEAEEEASRADRELRAFEAAYPWLKDAS